MKVIYFCLLLVCSPVTQALENCPAETVAKLEMQEALGASNAEIAYGMAREAFGGNEVSSCLYPYAGRTAVVFSKCGGDGEHVCKSMFKGVSGYYPE